MKVPPLGTTWEEYGLNAPPPFYSHSYIFLLYIILMVAISCDQWIHPPCNVYVSVLCFNTLIVDLCFNLTSCIAQLCSLDLDCLEYFFLKKTL